MQLALPRGSSEAIGTALLAGEVGDEPPDRAVPTMPSLTMPSLTMPSLAMPPLDVPPADHDTPERAAPDRAVLTVPSLTHPWVLRALYFDLARLVQR